MMEMELLAQIHTYCILGVYGIFVLSALSMLIRIQHSGHLIAGVPTIHRSQFVMGKFFLAVPLVATVLQVTGINLRQVAPAFWIHSLSIFLLVISACVIVASFWALGQSTRVGLPREDTALQTRGIYRISRNPMYVGVYILHLASVLYTMNAWVLMASIAAILIHHRIILGEEDFLRRRFQGEYERYCKRVRRYV